MKLPVLSELDDTLLRQIVHCSDSPILVTDALAPDCPVIFVNHAFEVTTGYTAEDTVGRNCRFLQGRDRDQPARALLATTIAKGQSCECRLRNYRKDGTMFWNQLCLFPILNERKTVTHFVGIQHDVSAVMSAQMELQRQREELAVVLERLERLSARLLDAQEQERKHVSRELHDELGQRLTCLNFLLYALRPDQNDAARLANWQQAIADMSSVIERVRDISIALRPPVLDLFPLEEAIRQLANRTFASAGIEYTLQFNDLPELVSERVRVSIYRLVQESLTNILRHSNATSATITIASHNEAIRLGLRITVTDNGIGFDAQAWRSPEIGYARSGLLGMRDRVQLLGGKLHIESAPGDGTSIDVFIPL